MAYLSKDTVLAAYNQLSKLTNDPSAQGATQVTSSLRYLFALDRFYKQFGRACDTQNRSDRDKFIEFVGEVVSVNDELYTANFYNSIKDNSDYAVGSNFFSVNTVKTSLENSTKDYDFPKRGNSPLFIIRDGKLFEKKEYLNNVGTILHNSNLCTAFVIWLVRNMEIDTNDNYGSIKTNLESKYSAELISKILPERHKFVENPAFTYQDTPASFSISDFPKIAAESMEAVVDILSPDALIAKVRESFLEFWSIIDQHGTQTLSYVRKFESAVNPFIAKLDIGYKSVFQIVNIDQYSNIITKLTSDFPDLGFLQNGRKNTGDKYEIASTHVHYANFLKIIALTDFRNNVVAQQDRAFHVAAKTSPADLSFYLRAMRTKPFLLLAGISGTGKSRIVKQLAFDSCPDNARLRQDPTSPGNYCLIEVKPNWHDSSELIGYESQIGQPHYVVTTFVRFLAKAMLYEEQRVPFFVCLDEMNLAPVEQYFAEFLSVLESRKRIGDKITSEALIPKEIFANVNYERQLKEDLFGLEVKKVSDEGGHQVYEGELPDDELLVYNRLKENGLRIPSNVIVIGTVNMDETTHQFSRKVIDRAITIEMNLPDGEPFMDFFINSRDLEYSDNPLSPDLFLSSFVKAADVVAELSATDNDKAEHLKKSVASILTALNEALNGTPFKIAYRVQNELVLYFYELWKEKTDADWDAILKESVDQILMMKVLPRVEGDEDLLEKPLERLANFCAPYPNASKKVAEMRERLDRSHFASYWP